jgi:hypothetical protein
MEYLGVDFAWQAGPSSSLRRRRSGFSRPDVGFAWSSGLAVWRHAQLGKGSGG